MRSILLLAVIAIIAGCEKEVPEPQDQPSPVSPSQPVSVCRDTISYLDASSFIIELHVKHYDSLGLLIKVEKFDDGMPEWNEVYEYASGFVSKMTLYNAAGEVDHYNTYERNAQGLVTREKWYYDNILTMDYAYTYNAAGERTLKQAFHPSTGLLDWYEESQFDSYHNPVYMIAIDDNGDTIRQNTRSYIYNGSGKIVEDIYCNLISGCTKTTYLYAGDTLKQEDFYFDSADAVSTNRYYYQYDSQNRLSQMNMTYGTGEYLGCTKYKYCQ